LGGATAVGAAAVGGLLPVTAHAAERGGPLRAAGQGGLVDTNISLGQWPWRRLALDETGALVARLRSRGVKEAWAASFEALLHEDLAAANARLVRECRKHGSGMLVPFGSVNPALPSWEEDLRRCREEHRMPGIRLHPNYHGYKLDGRAFGRLLDLAGERGLVVQVAVTMEDERTQHPLTQVPHVDVAPLLTLLPSRPGLRVELLNWWRGVKRPLLPELAAAGQVYFDIATVEGVGGVANLCEQVPVERVVFGSYAPYFYLESGVLKLKESAFSKQDLAAVQSGNARRLLGGPAKA